MKSRLALPWTAVLACAHALSAWAGLDISSSPSPVAPSREDPAVLVHHATDDKGGNTSLRFMARRKVDENKYPTNSVTVFAQAPREQPQRDRDLGQTFLAGDKGGTLDALFLRVGHADLAMLTNTPGARVAVQWFEVTGEPRLNDHSTPGFAGTFDRVTSPELDDCLEGETYQSLRVVEGRLPATLNPSDYLKLDFTGDDEFVLEPRRTYAFLLMFLERAPMRGMTLANEYYGTYTPDPANKFSGHGIRREGLPAFPDTWQQRLNQPPGTLGFPDVCTFRDLHFAVTVKGLEAASPVYEPRDIEGWQVLVQRALLDREPGLTARALQLLQKQLAQIHRVVPAPATKSLRAVPLYFSPGYSGFGPTAEFHPDAGWLRANGRDPAMAQAIEFTNIRCFEAEVDRMPNFTLHELAHAYHHRVLAEGFANPEIKAAYERAKANGGYNRVERSLGSGKPNTFERAYAMNNPMEYFAETTEAFFSRNDFFPFTRSELEAHDPVMFALLAQLWGADAMTEVSGLHRRTTAPAHQLAPVDSNHPLREYVAPLACAAALQADVVTVSAPDSPMLRFALGKLEAALQRHGDVLNRTAHPGPGAAPGIAVTVDPAALSATGPDGFRRIRSDQGLRISGADERGAMYGLLDVAEQIRSGVALDRISDRTARAQFEFRAIKFNLPWSAYRTSPALKQHQETCKDLRYWEAFLDMMAENRFNVLSLWSLHPFHYMIRPKNFPEACPFSDAELAEWRQLWSGIFAMAKERGIETYLLNWNIFVSPEFARAHNVAPWSVSLSHIGKEADATSDLVVRYTREVVAQVLDEYPDLTGLGITLGERMGGMTPDQRRDWLDQTFFAGIAEAKRPAKFIYRAPLSANTGSGGTTSEENDRRSRAQIESLSRNITGPVYVEFKHNWSHAHSSPDLFMVHGGPLSDAYWNPPPTRHKVVWTMRNEDMYILRWGQPDFVREFIQRQGGKDYVGGAIIGSECYIPALDYITKEGSHKTWRWAFQRQWLFYAVWGQLLYDPATPDARFEAMFNARFGKGVGKDLLAAWKLASRVPLHFASFHRGTWDGSLYTEGFSSWIDRDDGARIFFGIDAFIQHPVLDTKRYVNIADYVKTGRAPEGAMSPIELAAILERDCATAMKVVAELRARGGVSPTFDCELTDIEAWCAYGNYFAGKLRAGVALATARTKGDANQQHVAVAALEKALAHWKRLAELGAKFNQLPAPSNSKEPFSWSALTPAVEKDIETAKAPLTSTSSTR